MDDKIYATEAEREVNVAASLCEFAADESRSWSERRWALHRLLRMASDPNAPYPTIEQVKEHTNLYKEEQNGDY